MIGRNQRRETHMSHDLVIRGGVVIDGTGAPRRNADIGIRGGRIAEIGSISSRGAQEIDAAGALVTPGFVDIHTHYDGQATWASRLSPSSHHGVTTVVMGNCGVGFAPVKKTDHQMLVELMEGVEDIPGAALHEGLTWEWESFGDYLDNLGRRQYDMDVGAQLPHGPLRVYVMGERGAKREAATADDIAQMRRLAAEAMRAGAMGFTSSRTLNHRTVKGEPTPSLTASKDELLGIAMGLKDAGRGVIELISDWTDIDAEWDIFRDMVAQSGRPMTFSLGQGLGGGPDGWKKLMARVTESNKSGVPIRGQVAPRAIGIMLGLSATLNPLLGHESYAAIHKLPLAERVRIMRDPSFKAKLLLEAPGERFERMKRLIGRFDRLYWLGDTPNYEPQHEDSVAGMAEAQQRAPVEVIYELLLRDEGRALLYTPFANYMDGNLDACGEMMQHPDTVPGLGDGGAHVGTICDASYPTYLLTHWGRDRKRGNLLPLEWLVSRQTRDTARVIGLHDRGVLAPGMRADINVIDFDRLQLHMPFMVNDLPAGSARLNQLATGYLATLVNGQVTYRNGEATDALPGRLLRGAQPAP